MDKKNILLIIIIFFSFAFEGIFSNFISTYSFFLPLFVLMSLLIIYPFLLNDKSTFYKYCFFTGILYDLIYTDTIIVHGLLFLIVGFIITKINLILANNNINVIVMAIIVIFLYRTIMYSLLILTGNVYPNTFDYIQGVYLSIIANAIYVVILNVITDRLSIKLKLYKGN